MASTARSAAQNAVLNQKKSENRSRSARRAVFRNRWRSTAIKGNAMAPGQTEPDSAVRPTKANPKPRMNAPTSTAPAVAARRITASRRRPGKAWITFTVGAKACAMVPRDLSLVRFTRRTIAADPQRVNAAVLEALALSGYTFHQRAHARPRGAAGAQAGA